MKVRALRTGVCSSTQLAGPSATPAPPVGTKVRRPRVNLGIREGAVMIGRQDGGRAPGVLVKIGATGIALRKAAGRDKPKVIRSSGG